MPERIHLAVKIVDVKIHDVETAGVKIFAGKISVNADGP